jgi:hypothetical protein
LKRRRTAKAKAKKDRQENMHEMRPTYNIYVDSKISPALLLLLLLLCLDLQENYHERDEENQLHHTINACACGVSMMICRR